MFSSVFDAESRGCADVLLVLEQRLVPLGPTVRSSWTNHPLVLEEPSAGVGLWIEGEECLAE